jgi:outer membrane protein assembly factor BamB
VLRRAKVEVADFVFWGEYAGRRKFGGSVCFQLKDPFRQIYYGHAEKQNSAIHVVNGYQMLNSGSCLGRTMRAIFSLIPAFLFLCTIVCLATLATASDDWPMWRADASRSAATNNALPTELELSWSREFGARTQAWDDPLNLDLMSYDRTFEPIVLGGRLFLGFNDQCKLVALDAATGKTLWTYFAEGPVRLPPVGWKDRVFFCSDDGFLYCLRAETGELEWKFSGCPNSQHAIGNRRLTSAWPARGGPVVLEDKVYFAASIWPFMGTFIYALDAESGSSVWVNDRTGAQYIKQPHSAPSFAGVAPQGIMVATNDYLIVPGGRSVPAVFDRSSGDLKYFEINAAGKGTGGDFVCADALHFYVHTREQGTRAFELESGVKTAFTPNEPVLSDGFLYSAETSETGPVIRAYDVREPSNLAREPVWEIAASGLDDLIMADGKLVAAGNGIVSIIAVPDVAPEQVGTPKLLSSFSTENDVARLLVADETLFAVTHSGKIMAFAAKPPAPTQKADANEVLEQVAASPTEDAKIPGLTDLLDEAPVEGYAFWYGNSDDPRLWALATHSPFEQLIVVDDNKDRVNGLRRRLDERGLYGKVTVHASKAQEFRAPQYVGNWVFVAGPEAHSTDDLRAIYDCVRPYGGVMALLIDQESAPDQENAAVSIARINQLQLENAVAELNPLGVVVKRTGALTGAADWTHQYGNVANTIKSDDARVKLPLGILWFGGSSNIDVLPRHGHGPPEQVVGGRLFIQGMNCLSARDVYTGRVLWKRDFEDLGTYDIYYDATYEDTPLDPKYNQVHIPGANGRGTNYVVTEDRIYILDGGVCLMLDPATGTTVGKIELPLDADGNQPEWGYLGVYEDIVLGGIGFAKYRNRFGLEFEADKSLSASRAGFGSKSFDVAASRGLAAFDRHSGKLLWQAAAKHSFWHNGIVAGSGRIYCLDKNPTPIEEAMRRRGMSLPDSYRIVCYDAATGQTNWEVKEGIFGTWLGYSEQHDLLLQAGAQASDRLYAEVGQGMRVYKAATGELEWKKDALKYAGPCILHNDLIFTNANSYSESAGAFYLKTGEQRMVKNPITGAIQPWTMTRAYGCNNIIASENLLTFRSGSAGYYDLLSDSGTGNLGGFKSGCTSNLVVANGVLNAPDYTRTCSCGYQNQTSLALVHMPEIEMWSVNAQASVASSSPALESFGINFGAPGDRRDADGFLWLEYPIVGGDSPPMNIQLNPEAAYFQQHASTMGDAPQAWIAASGVDGVTELRIDLDISPRRDLAEGIAVASAEDDAEESERGEVSLSSSDLELVNDDGQQTVGLRFADLPLSRGAKIREAYIQFTCDEASSEPTSLNIVGELAPNARPFREESHDLSSRTASKSEVAWNVPEWTKPGESGAAQRSPNLAAVVQEVVDQPDWSRKNSMALLISGTGKRIASSSTGSNADAARLIVHADQNNAEEQEPDVDGQPYNIELIFAAPRASEERIFDVSAQGQVVLENVHVAASGKAGRSTPTKISIADVLIGKQLVLTFQAKQGLPLLSGIKLSRSPTP